MAQKKSKSASSRLTVHYILGISILRRFISRMIHCQPALKILAIEMDTMALTHHTTEIPHPRWLLLCALWK
jgi:hypothetical protein